MPVYRNRVFFTRRKTKKSGRLTILASHVMITTGLKSAIVRKGSPLSRGLKLLKNFQFDIDSGPLPVNLLHIVQADDLAVIGVDNALKSIEQAFVQVVG